MSSRPEIAEALDVRSYERVIVITRPDSEFEYPEGWDVPAGVHDADVTPESVVIVDRVELTRRNLATLAAGRPRLLAFAVPSGGVDYEKQVRRTVTSLFPWSELWTVWTDFGKTLVTKDVRGQAYDRADVVDMREGADA